ncbi:MAG TPA: hypothetical protein VIZ61_07525 [Solirubrobacterales bacterium]
MGEAADLVRAASEQANANDPDKFHDVPEITGSTTYCGRHGIRDWLRTVHDVSELNSG